MFLQVFGEQANRTERNVSLPSLERENTIWVWCCPAFIQHVQGWSWTGEQEVSVWAKRAWGDRQNMGLFWKRMGTETVVVSEGQHKGKLASCVGGRRVLIQGRALRSAVYCSLKNLLDNKMVKDILTINPGITVLIRIRWYDTMFHWLQGCLTLDLV